MNKSIMVVGIASALIGELCMTNLASARKVSASKDNDPQPQKISPRAIGGADAKEARLAALIDGDSVSFNVVRSKGVASVIRNGIGLYCIRPSISLNPKTIVPTVSVDFSTSPQIAVLAQYRSSSSSCPDKDKDIAVITFEKDISGNSFFASNNVGFTIVVP